MPRGAPCSYGMLFDAADFGPNLAVQSASQAPRSITKTPRPQRMDDQFRDMLVPMVTDTLTEVTRVTPATLWRQRVDGQIVDLAIVMVVVELINSPRKEEASGAWELRLQWDRHQRPSLQCLKIWPSRQPLE